MTRLPLITWEVMLGWLLIGLVIYFGYSMKQAGRKLNEMLLRGIKVPSREG